MQIQQMPATRNHPPPPRFSHPGKQDGWGFSQRGNRSLHDPRQGTCARSGGNPSSAFSLRRARRAKREAHEHRHIHQRQDHPAPIASRLEFPRRNHQNDSPNHARRTKRRWKSEPREGTEPLHDKNDTSLIFPYSYLQSNKINSLHPNNYKILELENLARAQDDTYQTTTQATTSTNKPTPIWNKPKKGSPDISCG